MLTDKAIAHRNCREFRGGMEVFMKPFVMEILASRIWNLIER